MNASRARRALVSVSDKTGLDVFAKGLAELGFEIVSTGGTRKFLEGQGVPVVDISSYTGFPEIMDGRVKTLHPKVHGAILGRPDLPGDAQAIAEHGIVPFTLVVCNLYPFEQTIAKEGVKREDAIEQIDIGGPSMVRSAAKNHAYVGIVTRADQYNTVLEALREGELSEPLRRALAAAAFEMTARYDRAIADYLAATDTSGADAADAAFPPQLSLNFRLVDTLRYGENPHQQAAVYAEPNAAAGTLTAARKLHGKELSYNNLLDLDAALAIVGEYADPAAVVIKHNNPCGCAVADTLAEAFEKAHAGDPVSAFGSIVSLNRPVDAATAELMCRPNQFIEAVIAPGFSEEALTAITTRPTWKNSVRLLECAAPGSVRGAARDYRRISGGLLVQDRDNRPDPEDEWQVVTERVPTEDEWRNLRFVWPVCKHVKSNAIVFAKGGAVVGVGAGQMSRVDSAFIAGHKAGERSRGAVVASDAFFPFRDGIDEAARAGITAVIQPGGSKRDAEVIAACNEHGMAMVFTSRRHFKH